MYIAVPPLLHSTAVSSKLNPSITTELRGTLSGLNLVSLTPKISNVKLCSEIRGVSLSMRNESDDMQRRSQDFSQCLQNIVQNYDDNVIIMMLMSIS